MRFGKAAWLAALLLGFPPLPTLAQTPPEREAFSFEARRLQGIRAEVSALLMHGAAGGELPMAALAWPEIESLAGSGNFAVRLLVELEGLALLEGSDGQKTRSIEIHVYAVGSDGSVSGYLSQVIHIDLESWAEVLAGRGLRWSDSFELPADEYSLRILAKDRESGRYGMRILPLILRSTEDSEPTRDPVLWGPFATESQEPWLRVRGANEASELIDLPAAMPVAQVGETIEMVLWGSGLRDPADFVATIAPSRAPEKARPVPVSRLERNEMAIEAVQRVVVRATLPAMASGSYRLTFSAHQKGRNPTAAIELFVLDGLDLPGPLVWCHLRAVIAGGAEASIKPQESQHDERSKKKRVASVRRAAKQGYEDVLRRLSAGDRRAAVDQLIRLEAGLATDEEAVKALHRAELGIAQSLAEHEREILLPLCLLHLDAYREQRLHQRSAAAIHSRELIAELAALWVELDDRETTRNQASDVLVCLALELMDANLREIGREALRQALVWQPGHETAGLQLALSYERSALYHEAALALRDLIEVNPKQAEARLRLAVNLARDNQPSKARRIHQQLLGEHNPDWILCLAYEELARLDHAAGRLDEAISLLSSGIGRLPGQQGLYLVMANLLDRAGRSEEAADLLGSMPYGVDSSPRYRYSQPPLPAIYSSLLPSANARLGFLARALDATSSDRKGR